MNTIVRTKLCTAIFSMYGATALCALQVSNAAADPVPTRRVSYADLDISKQPGAKVLYRRITAAAHEVCTFEGVKELGASYRYHDCINQAIDTAVKQVNSAALSELRSAGVIHLSSN